MSRTRRLVLALAAMGLAVLLASGVALAANFTGTDGDDTIDGSSSADWMRGHAGNDTISGKDGDDDIGGERGDDTISGNSGGDTIGGGPGNDYLFGTDEYQTGIEDGNRTSTDGNDVIRGEDGDDTIVGASGADKLYGGGDADTIIEGPANDASVDYMYGGDGNDNIDAASAPASKDVIDCGAGTDEVQADPLDDVRNTCEKVDILDLSSSSLTPSASTLDTTEIQPPTVISTESEPSVNPDAEPPPQDETPPQDGMVSAQYTWDYYLDFKCWVAPRYRGWQLCAATDVATYRDLVGVGVYQTWDRTGAFSTGDWYQVDRWIWFAAWNTPTGRFLGETLVHPEDDYHNWMFRVRSTRVDPFIYGKTSCWSNCSKWTWVSGWWDIDYQ